MGEITPSNNQYISIEYEIEKNNWINSATHNEMYNDLTESIPKLLSKYEWLKFLKISYIKIKKIENIPKNINVLMITNTLVTNIQKNDIPNNIDKLILNDNYISEIDIETLPINLTVLNLENNGLSKIINMTYLTKLKELQLSKNNLSILPELPKSLEKLDVSRNRLINVNNIPSNVTELDCSNNEICCLDNLPNLIKLVAYNNNIRAVTNLPSTLEYLDISHNEISYLNFPPNIIELDLSHNNLTYINTYIIPDSLVELDISHNKKLSQNKLREIHEKIKGVRITSDYKNDDDIMRYNLFDSDNEEQESEALCIPWYYQIQNNWRHNINAQNIHNQSYNTTSKSKHSKLNPYYIIHNKTIKI